MTRFFSQTIVDMRNGRETWRVLATLSTLAFALAVLKALTA